MSADPPSISRSRTKIVATVGPACWKPEQLIQLVRSGVSVFRLNMAHANREVHERSVAAIRAASKELNQPIAMLADLAGPKIRLGELPGNELDCTPDLSLSFIRGSSSSHPHELVSTYDPLVDELKVGDSVMLADGTVSLVVESKEPDRVRCRVLQAGIIRSRQGINLPGVKLSAPSMDEDDIDNAIWAAKVGLDFVGLSFVRQASDLVELKNLLKKHNSTANVIAKIEKPEALENLESIVEAADGIMVARGDLGVEIDVAQMPIKQKEIIASCRRHQKPVIIATQMLDSMQRSRRPTRAEVTDVANAILDGGDACMLSGETAIGEYPREAVEMMRKIALATEEMYRNRPPQETGKFLPPGMHPITRAVVQGAGHIASELGAKVIVVATHSGVSALALAKQRNYVPTIGVSDLHATLRKMCLYWGVVPILGAPTGSSTEMLDYTINWAREQNHLKAGDLVVALSGAALGTGSHNTVSVHQVT